MKNRNVIIYLTGIVISMIIAIFFINKTQNKIDKLEYTLDNSNLESNIAIMVYDDSLKDYVQSDRIPIGSYKLNEDRTKCSSGGKILNYNNRMGTIDYTLTTADECYVYIDAYFGAVKTIVDLYTGQGVAIGNGKLYLHDSTLENSANDGSYRFAGTDPNNYVCFEGDTCDDNHKYRVIGAFGENLKVIKMTSIGDKVWNNSNVNTWENSTMDTYLNGEWLTSFGHGDLIEDYDWHVGGHNAYKVTAKVMYDAELNSTPILNRKVGLMYASDFGYAALNNYWTTSLYSYDSSAHTTDWLKLGTNEWTILRDSDNYGYAFPVNSAGSVNNSISVRNGRASRPSFYLKSSVEIKSGSGTKTDPWIISI